MTWTVPNVTFAFREGDEPPTEGGGCPIGGEFVFKTTQDLFANKPHDLAPIKRRC